MKAQKTEKASEAINNIVAEIEFRINRIQINCCDKRAIDQGMKVGYKNGLKTALQIIREETENIKK